MDKQNLKKIIIFSVVAIIFVASFYIFFNYQEQEKIKENTSLVSGETDTGWSNVPNVDSLTLLASDQNGGQLDKLVFYKDEDTEIYYSKAEILGDYDALYLYFRYSNSSGWGKISEESLPPKVKTALDEKL